MVSRGDLQRLLENGIPITQSMGIEVQSWTQDSLTLSAPLSENRNDKNTAFAGSIYSVAVLTGWSFLQMLIKDADIAGQVVIQESRVKFFRPVTGNIVAKCGPVVDVERDGFLDAFRQKGKARMPLVIQILQDDQLAVEFEGQYVAYQ